ncbi:hypothetical protein RLEG12_07985 (plasmid) [Rhizobium leguminosarum bv. trifolii CB782]|nr:hypothetical protein RLEG12_07985 [Rhizobium leguminosarum bv. trifolii CB782]
MIASTPRILRLWSGKATLTARLFAILFIGAFFTYGSAFSVLLVERYIFAREIMLGSLGADIATAVAVLDRLPATERPYWLGRLSRENYKVLLGRGAGGGHLTNGSEPAFASEIDKAIDDRYALSVDTYPDADQQLQAHLRLSDGQPLTIHFLPQHFIEFASWVPYVIIAQMTLTLILTWISVRANVEPFVTFSEAVDKLQPKNTIDKLAEVGPIEVVKAARAVNLLIDRVDHYLKDRMQILAAVSHDLKTPLTRMRLRIETDVAEPTSGRLISDVVAMQELISEGVALAKSADSSENLKEVDFVALIENLATRYQKSGG